MKQTAVEWLVEQLQLTRDFQRVINEVNQSSTSVRDVLEEAKEMEKEQMKVLYSMWIVNKKTMELYDFEQYYNETYGK